MVITLTGILMVTNYAITECGTVVMISDGAITMDIQ